jgi:hypothetical protein
MPQPIELKMSLFKDSSTPLSWILLLLDRFYLSLSVNASTLSMETLSRETAVAVFLELSIVMRTQLLLFSHATA